jgi:hypothetical protein
LQIRRFTDRGVSPFLLGITTAEVVPLFIFFPGRVVQRFCATTWVNRVTLSAK